MYEVISVSEMSGGFTDGLMSNFKMKGIISTYCCFPYVIVTMVM